jgi:hypothetical protein
VPQPVDAPAQPSSTPALPQPEASQLQASSQPALQVNAPPQPSAPATAPMTSASASANPAEAGSHRAASVAANPGDGGSHTAANPSETGSHAPAPIAEKPLDVEPLPAPPQPVKVFDAKLLSLVDTKARELEARLVLEDKMLTVTPADNVGKPFETVPYEKVKSISYSVSRDPLWMSPRGPAPVVRRGGALSMFGISMPRHWVALRTASNTFVVLRVSESTAPALVASLEERTGRHSHRFAEVKRFKD